jgi:hypothetical protein
MAPTSTSLMRQAGGVTLLVGILLLGALLAACGSTQDAASTTTTSAGRGTTTTAVSTSGASSSVSKIEALSSSLQGAETASFKAVYTVTNAGMSQTVTIEQAPPKSLFSTKSGTVIDTGTTTYFCSDTGQPSCVSTGASDPLASLTELFSPQTAITELKAVQAEAAAHASGYSISFSSGNYGGQSTTCANVTGPTAPVKYCVTKQGLLAYASSTGAILSLTSYSSSAPAADFALPAGATIMTVPARTP